MSKSKTKVCVIFGGVSGEHNVSIQSAITVVNALKQGENANRFEVISLYIDSQGRWMNNNVAKEVLSNGRKPSTNETPEKLSSQGFRYFPEDIEEIDVWFPVLHGPNGEDGTIQGLLKLTGKPFVGSGVLGSALGMDKIAMKIAFASANLPQVKYFSINKNELINPHAHSLFIKRIEAKLGYPCFIKPANLGSSVGITKAYNKQQLIEGLNIAANHDPRIVIEESVIGRELECGVLGKEKMIASTVGEVKHQSDWYDYQAKYSGVSSEVLIPAPISEEISKKIQELSLLACKAISVEGIARVDFFYKEDTNHVLINEINTLPGFTMQSMYPMLWNQSGLNIEKLVAILVETAQD